MAQLSPDEITLCRSQDWVSPQWRLPGAQVAVLRDALDDLLRRNPGARPEKRVSAHIERAGRDNGEGVRGVAAFLDLARDPALVELVSGVIGDDVIPVFAPGLGGAQQFWPGQPRNRSWTRPSGPCWGALARRDDAAGSCPRGGATPPACASAAQSGA